MYFATSTGNREGETGGVSGKEEEEEEEEEMLTQIEEDILDVFADVYMNKHLVFGVMELVVVRLVPELGERGWEDLMGERGVVMAGAGGG